MLTPGAPARGPLRGMRADRRPEPVRFPCAASPERAISLHRAAVAALPDCRAVLAIALALGSSACYGVSNFIGPQLARRHAIVTILVVSQVAALIGCALYLAGDRGAGAAGRQHAAGACWRALGNGAGLIGFYKAAELGPLSIVAPIGATGAIVPVAYGLATGDTLKATQVAGVVLAMAGAALAARARAGGRAAGCALPGSARERDLGAAARRWRSASSSPPCPKASEDGRAWALFDARLALLALLALWAGRRIGGLRRHARPPAHGDPRPAARGRHGALHGGRRPRPALARVGGRVAVPGRDRRASAWRCSGERLSRAQAIGVSAAMAGVVLIAL